MPLYFPTRSTASSLPSLKLSQIPQYIIDVSRRAREIIAETQKRMAPAEASDVCLLATLSPELENLLHKIDDAMKKVGEPGWNPLSYGRQLLTAADTILCDFHCFVFDFYTLLHKNGLLTDVEAGQITAVDEAMAAIEKECNVLLTAGLGATISFQKENDAFKALLQMKQFHYQPESREALENTAAFQYFLSECAALLQEMQEKFNHLEIDYMALHYLAPIAQAAISLAIGQIEAVFSKLPDFTCTIPRNTLLLTSFEGIAVKKPRHSPDSASSIGEKSSLEARPLLKVS